MLAKNIFTRFLINRSLASNKKSIQLCQSVLGFHQTKFIRADSDSNDSKNTTSEKRFKIYTRTGDKGKSSLYTGERLFKNNIIFEALGNADELNSSLGLAREFCTDKHEIFSELENKLIRIQCVLLDIGSHIATPRTRAQPKQLERLSNFDPKLTKELENWIDAYDLELPPLRNFILPSGGKCASSLHLSRSICRRLERSMQPLLQSNDLENNVMCYVNRLSDFLFTAARYAALKEAKEEIIYKKP